VVLEETTAGWHTGGEVDSGGYWRRTVVARARACEQRTSWARRGTWRESGKARQRAKARRVEARWRRGRSAGAAERRLGHGGGGCRAEEAKTDKTERFYKGEIRSIR
jgi:hypothetical protein